MADANTTIYTPTGNGGSSSITLGQLATALAYPVATTTTAGVVKQSATQAASVAVDVAGVVTDFNALLTKLKAAGLMA